MPSFSHFFPENYRKLCQELETAVSFREPNTIIGGVSRSFHKATVTLDEPPVLNPPELAAVGLTDVCALSFTLNTQPFKPTTAKFIDSSKRPNIYMVRLNFRFFAMVRGSDGKEEPHNVHILTCCPPCEEMETENGFEEPLDSSALFYTQGRYSWTAVQFNKDFPGRRTVSMILKLPPGYDLNSPIIFQGNLILGNAYWEAPLGYSRFIKKVQKHLSLTEPSTEFQIEDWAREHISFFPIEKCDLYSLGTAMGWQGASATQGISRLSIRMGKRHRYWIEKCQEDYEKQKPFIDVYGDTQGQLLEDPETLCIPGCEKCPLHPRIFCGYGIGINEIIFHNEERQP